MPARTLSDLTRVVVASGPVAAGQTPVVGPLIDLHGAESVRVLAVLGAAADGATPAVRLQAGDRADGADQADVAGLVTAAAGSLAGKVLSLDAVGFGKRYCRPVVTRAGGDAAVTCVLAEVYDHARTPAGGGDVAVTTVRTVKRMANGGHVISV